MQSVFVYGTLKSGEPNHAWMTEWSQGKFQSIGRGRTAQAYPLIIGTHFNIPFMVDKPGVGHQVEGEVYDVDDNMMRRLDELEEHPDFYKREQRTVLMEDGTEHLCWIYLIQRFRENLLDNASFLCSYSSSGPHGLVYCERYLRPDKGYTAKDDIQGTLP